ncbi:DUF72 domain-containing protein [bacterium]|nr:DUF72 domain-containing protein [bacterium]
MVCETNPNMVIRTQSLQKTTPFVPRQKEKRLTTLKHHNLTIRLGTSSFSEDSWKGVFYPEGTDARDYLPHYATVFDTVEVDATYYAIPRQSTVDRWAEVTPESFLFSLKFPRAIVHGGEGRKPDPKVLLLPDTTYDARDAFLERVKVLGPRLGPLLLQFPYFNKTVFASRTEFFERLDRFLEDLPKQYRYAVEVRNKWYMNRELAELCRRHGVSMAVVDQQWMPHGDELSFDPVTNDLAYIRLLGNRKEIEEITDSWDREVIDRGDRLQRWADLIGGWENRDLTILVYSNNHYAGHAPETTRRLKALLEDRF